MCGYAVGFRIAYLIHLEEATNSVASNYTGSSSAAIEHRGGPRKISY